MEAKTADVHPQPEHDIVQRLQQENAALRAELQALRSITLTAASHSTTHADHEHSFDFVKLPRELRNEVYELCVVVGEVRIGDDDWAQWPDMRYKGPKSAKAEVALFTTNKQIRLEALEVYISKNHFIVPNAAMWSPLRARYTRYMPGHSNPPLVLRHLRSISIPFDFRSRADENDGRRSIDFHIGRDKSDEVDFTIEHHNDYAVSLHRNFNTTLYRMIMEHQQLRRLQINVQNATCRLGCHRLVVIMFRDNYFKQKLEAWVFSPLPKRLESLEFLGTINDEERRVIRSAFPDCLRSKITFRGQFDSVRGVWDPDVEIFDEMASEHDAPDLSSKGSSSEDSSLE